jgi:hypothetical protein
MMQRFLHRIRRTRGVRVLMLLVVFACLFSGEAAAFFSLNNQGYLFLHPFFKTRPWAASLERLDLTWPDTLATFSPKSFDVSLGGDSAIAVFSVAGGDLYLIPVRYQTIVAPCYDNYLEFDIPRKITLNGLGLPASRQFYVVKDSLYSFDSIRVAMASAVSPLRLLIATIRANTSAVVKIDTVNFAELKTGQNIVGVSGYPDSITQQDRGLWVTGAKGLVRYVQYNNHRWGGEALRDLSDTSTVTHSNGTYAGTLTGKIFRRNVSDTFFTLAATASRAVWRVYPRGVVGDNGLFKENVNDVWRTDTNFGASMYRYANFIRRPGGFGVELLDTGWTYRVFTYRDSMSRIVSSTPASLMTNINSTPYIYNGVSKLDITVTIDDPDSNFSDYKLRLFPAAGGTVDLKNDGKDTIRAISDSENCHIGVLKMTSGRLRLTLTDTAILVMHDCAVGTLNPTCLTCYWKTYNFSYSKRWAINDVLRIETSTQNLRIARNAVTVIGGMASEGDDSDVLRISVPGISQTIRFPIRNGVLPHQITIHDLQGRLLVSLPVTNQRTLFLPISCRSGVIIVSCIMADRSIVRQKVPVFK